MAVASDVPVPPQMPVPATYDFRNAMTAPKGHKDRRKRKLDDYAELVGLPQPACTTSRPQVRTEAAIIAVVLQASSDRMGVPLSVQAATLDRAGGKGRGRSCNAGRRGAASCTQPGSQARQAGQQGEHS